ncbi:LicD family protein [bacterium D16-51]|nr:LicD family protein [bacterium D16-59]RKI62293.1 LicD family protein [bacterium D16-51]
MILGWKEWKRQYRAMAIFSDDYIPIKESMVSVLKKYKEQGKQIAIWGGGIKGTAFLKVVDPYGKYISYAIDIKKEKAGEFIAGREILYCYDLKGRGIDVVLMMSQKHFVQNYNILQDEGITCSLHDIDEIVKKRFSAKEILMGKDMESDNAENQRMTKEVQKELLPILKEVKRLCVENDIPYFLCAGSALGAVRHQGFIPWDDDIDIGMFRKDYIRFLKIARKKLSDGYILIDANDTPNYYVGHAKVFKDHTALVNRETSHLKIHHGFYLDIFPFDTIPEEEEKQEYMYQKAADIKKVFTIMKRREKYNGKNPIKRYFANEQYYKAKMKSPKKVFHTMNQILTQYLESDYKMVADLFAPYNKKLFYKMEDIYPPILMQFEDDVYPVPGNYDKYLSVMYGDYMELPPEDKRFVKHDIICFDKKHNYSKDEKWMKKCPCFSRQA